MEPQLQRVVVPKVHQRNRVAGDGKSILQLYPSLDCTNCYKYRQQFCTFGRDHSGLVAWLDTDQRLVEHPEMTVLLSEAHIPSRLVPKDHN